MTDDYKKNKNISFSEDGKFIEVVAYTDKVSFRTIRQALTQLSQSGAMADDVSISAASHSFGGVSNPKWGQIKDGVKIQHDATGKSKSWGQARHGA